MHLSTEIGNICNSLQRKNLFLNLCGTQIMLPTIRNHCTEVFIYAKALTNAAKSLNAYRKFHALSVEDSRVCILHGSLFQNFDSTSPSVTLQNHFISTKESSNTHLGAFPFSHVHEFSLLFWLV